MYRFDCLIILKAAAAYMIAGAAFDLCVAAKKSVFGGAMDSALVLPRSPAPAPVPPRTPQVPPLRPSVSQRRSPAPQTWSPLHKIVAITMKLQPSH
jgi:hypothetical protein